MCCINIKYIEQISYVNSGKIIKKFKWGNSINLAKISTTLSGCTTKGLYLLYIMERPSISIYIGPAAKDYPSGIYTPFSYRGTHTGTPYHSKRGGWVCVSLLLPVKYKLYNMYCRASILKVFKG